VQQVFDKYVAAVGSPEAVKQFQTQSLKGNAVTLGRSQPYEVFFKAPDKFLFVLQGSRVKVAHVGDTGWAEIGGRARIHTAAESAEAKRIGETLPLVKFTPSATMRVAGRRKVGERDAVVVVDRLSEALQRRYFFDAETGLLLRVVTLRDAILNQIPTQVDFEDYRDVDGVKMPFTVRVSSVVPSENQTRTVTDVKPGVPIDDKIFDMPTQQ
jgi:hypothetical protein